MLISPRRQTFSVSDLLVCKLGTLQLPFTLLCLSYLFQKQAGQARDCLCGCIYLHSLASTMRSPSQLTSLAVLIKNEAFKGSDTEHPQLSACGSAALVRWQRLPTPPFRSHCSVT